MSQGKTDNERAVAEAWGEYYRPGMSQEEAQAFKAGFAAHRVTLVADSREALRLAVHKGIMPQAMTVFGTLGSQEAYERLLDSITAEVSGVVSVTEPAHDRAYLADHEHTPVQHRDAKEPWCRECGLTKDGQEPVSRFTSRPAPVAPPTEEWEDPEPWQHGFRIRHGNADRSKSCLRGGCVRNARTREQYEADQKPVVPMALTDEQADILTLVETFDSFDALTVPVDALGFPTQVGATFRAVVRGFRAHRKFTVLESSMVFRYMDAEGGCWLAVAIDHTSIEDVRPADGRNGQ